MPRSSIICRNWQKIDTLRCNRKIGVLKTRNFHHVKKRDNANLMPLSYVGLKGIDTKF